MQKKYTIYNLEMCKNIKHICIKYNSFLTIVFIIIYVVFMCSDYVNYKL